MKILLIDDESLDLFIAQKQLSTTYEVKGFTSFKEGIAWAKENDFDLALIDYYLDTYIMGSDVLKELISIKGSTFKAFLLTNHVDAQQVKMLKEAGFHEIIFKPITAEKLKTYLEP